jgi:hypothetical protein
MDFQNKKTVVLKVYHVKHAMTVAVNEFKMLHALSNCPSVERAFSLMYNSNGSFLVLSLEDLSNYQTLY